ncbi:hypothetical protein OKW45_003854 [Paraburkholderia sp. WSM4175]
MTARFELGRLNRGLKRRAFTRLVDYLFLRIAYFAAYLMLRSSGSLG